MMMLKQTCMCTLSDKFQHMLVVGRPSSWAAFFRPQHFPDTIPGCMCKAQKRLCEEPATKKDASTLQLASWQRCLYTFTIPSWACLAQNRTPFAAHSLKVARILQPACSHFRVITSTILCCLCELQYRPEIMPATLKTGCVLQPACRHKTETTSTMSCFLCFLQYRPLAEPLVLKSGWILQPVVQHLALMTSTMPAFLCLAQYIPATLPSKLKYAVVEQEGVAHGGLFISFILLAWGCIRDGGCSPLKDCWEGSESTRKGLCGCLDALIHLDAGETFNIRVCQWQGGLHQSTHFICIHMYTSGWQQSLYHERHANLIKFWDFQRPPKTPHPEKAS